MIMAVEACLRSVRLYQIGLRLLVINGAGISFWPKDLDSGKGRVGWDGLSRVEMAQEPS